MGTHRHSPLSWQRWSGDSWLRVPASRLPSPAFPSSSAPFLGFLLLYSLGLASDTPPVCLLAYTCLPSVSLVIVRASQSERQPIRCLSVIRGSRLLSSCSMTADSLSPSLSLSSVANARASACDAGMLVLSLGARARSKHIWCSRIHTRAH